MIEFLFLDLDDTILDFHKAERIALEKTFRAHGLNPAPEIMARYSAINKRCWEKLERGELTAGHARTLLSFKDETALAAAAKRVAVEGISVRELEKMAKKANEAKPEKTKPAQRRIRYYDEAELALRDTLNRVVHVGGTKKKGVLTIEFYGEEDLKNLLEELKLNDKV